MTPEALLIWLADFSVKGLVILALAWAIVGSMRRASAAARHTVWMLAVLAALLLPGLSVALPQWQVKIIPATLFPSQPLVELMTEGTPEQKDAISHRGQALRALAPHIVAALSVDG